MVRALLGLEPDPNERVLRAGASGLPAWTGRLRARRHHRFRPPVDGACRGWCRLGRGDSLDVRLCDRSWSSSPRSGGCRRGGCCGCAVLRSGAATASCGSRARGCRRSFGIDHPLRVRPRRARRGSPRLALRRAAVQARWGYAERADDLLVRRGVISRACPSSLRPHAVHRRDRRPLERAFGLATVVCIPRPRRPMLAFQA